MSANGSPILIAIVGGSGSGKTWLAGGLQKVLAEKAACLSLDDFYLDRAHLAPIRREKLNYDHPRQIDWACVEEVLHRCRSGKPVRVPRYDFRAHVRTGYQENWRPRPVVVVEGLWLLLRPAVRRCFSLKLFLASPERLRLRRRIERDLAERGRSGPAIRRQFFQTVAPMHRRDVAPQVRWADLELPVPLRESDIGQLADALWQRLGNGAVYPIWMRETFRSELGGLLQASPRRHV